VEREYVRESNESIGKVIVRDRGVQTAEEEDEVRWMMELLLGHLIRGLHSTRWLRLGCRRCCWT
jgi:hypothetical protein